MKISQKRCLLWALLAFLGIFQNERPAWSQAVASGFDENSSETSEPYEIAARFVCETDSNIGYLIVQVRLAEGRHLYSLTQPGALATRIEVSLGVDARIDGVLRPDSPPVIEEQDELLQSRSEKHFGEVNFVLPIRRLTARPAETWKIAVRVNGQVCSESGSCVLLKDEIVSAKFAQMDDSTRRIIQKMSVAERALSR